MIMVNKNSLNVSRERIEDFLFLEASLLDEWKLDDWLHLLAENCTYQVPSNDAPASIASKALFMIADDKRRTEERVVRLKDRNAHAEFPHSRTRRFISNVRILERTDLDSSQSKVKIQANFTIHRFRRNDDIRTFVGQYQHELLVTDQSILITHRKAILDAYELGSMGLVSFIL
jgi:p-cumate 2,3-dioxygenase beta subunit